MSNKLICLVSGGTGGHVYPALGLAEALHKKGHHVLMVTDSRGKVFQESEYITQVVKLPVYRGVGPFKALIMPLTMALSLIKSLFIFLHYRPDVVVGFGGYPSVPAMMAAKFLGKHRIVHEQNAVMGRANRLALKGAHKVITAFEKVHHVEEKHEPVFVGNPVRASILAVRNYPYQLPKEGESFNILVVGGSQGAEIFTKVVPETLSMLPDHLKKNIHVHQQCRPEQYEATIEAYRDAGVTADVKPFFDDMDKRLRLAHLVICRSGASTVAELSVAGRPAIFVPYPHAMDDHQYHNAQALVDCGAAVLMAQNIFQVERLLQQVQNLMSDQKKLVAMAQAMKNYGRPEAANDLADLVLSVNQENQ